MFNKIFGGGIGIGGVGLFGYYLYNRNKKENIVNINLDKKEIKKIDNLWVETNLDQKTILALSVLEKKGYDINYVVWGNRDLNKLYCYNDNNIKYIKSEKLNINNDKLIENSEYMNELRKYINMGNNMMIMIKKPDELFNNFLNNKEDTKKIMNNIDCYLYSSYIMNLLNDDNKDDIIEFLSSFRNLYIFDTVNAVGSTKKELNNKYYEKILGFKDFNLFDGKFCSGVGPKTTFYYKFEFGGNLDYIIREGNMRLNMDNKVLSSYYDIEEKIKSKMSEYNKDMYKRTYNTYENRLLQYEYEELFADVGLALCVIKKEYFKDRVRIDFNEKNEMVFKKDDKSNIYTVLNESYNNNIKDLLIEDLSNLYKN